MALAMSRAGNGTAGTGDITPVATANRTTGVAPFGVVFDATATTTALTAIPFHEVHHQWHFGDDDTATWGYGTKSGVSKKNLAEGAIAAHVFETPGVKTVRYTPIYVSSGGLLSVGATQTITITVTDPDVVFSGANTICIANGTLPVVGVNGVPTGAACYNETTWAGVLSRLATGKRVLLKKGDTWVGANGSFTAAGPGIVGAYGTGANPKITYPSSSIHLFTATGSMQDWRFMDLEGDASGLATGVARAGTVFYDAGNGDPSAPGTSMFGRYCTLLRITQNNSGGLALCGNDNIVVDCVADGLNGASGNVSYYTQHHERVAVLGCSSQNAINGEHNLRLQGTQCSVVSNCTFTIPAQDKHALAVRGYANASTGVFEGYYSEKVVISDNVLIGQALAPETVKLAPQNTSKDERLRDILFERNYVTSEKNYGQWLMSGGVERLTVRNNLSLLKLGSSGAIASNGSSWAGNSFAIVPPVNHAYYNNTCYAEEAAAHGIDAFYVNSANATGMLFYNNVVYTPAYSGGKRFILVTGGSSYTAANNSSDAQMGSTSPNFVATPPVSYTDWKPTSGYAVNGGTYVPVFTDFFGVARTGTADMGAVNP